MPEEVYSERNRLAEDGTLSKVLFYDIVRQLRRPAGLASVDTDNCYDRIAHPMASMVFQSFGVPTPAIESMLTTIQNMKFFLRTGYGDSTNYAGGESMDVTDPVKTQGMCQGNTAAPAAWTVTSIPMIGAHKRRGHGAHFIAPISDITGHIAGGLFVDDTDLVHVDMRTVESIVEAHSRLQESVINQENAHTTSSRSDGKRLAHGYTRTTPSTQTWLLVFPWRTAAWQKLNTYQ